MRDIDVLIDELQRAHAGDPWHGPSRADILSDVPAAEAARRPPGGAHSIWELVLHMAAWTGEVARRLAGNAPSTPTEGDWPPQPAEASDTAWTEALAKLDASHQALAAAVRAFPPERLGEVVHAGAASPAGSGVTYGATLRGVLQHDAYHSGQIAVLKRVLRALD